VRYIECNHCQKRYPSNHKFEEAARQEKSVRCSSCNKPFKIVVYEVKDGKEPEPVKIVSRENDEMLNTIIRNARID